MSAQAADGLNSQGKPKVLSLGDPKYADPAFMEDFRSMFDVHVSLLLSQCWNGIKVNTEDRSYFPQIVLAW